MVVTGQQELRVMPHLIATDPHVALVAAVKQHRPQCCRASPPMHLLDQKQTNACLTFTYIPSTHPCFVVEAVYCAPTCTMRSNGRPKTNRVIDSLDVGIRASRGRTSQYELTRTSQRIKTHQIKGVGVSVKKQNIY